jgi:hypothetical protein
MKVEKRKKFGNLVDLSLVAMVLALILGCSMMDAVGDAQDSVEEFHSLMNLERFEEIYEKSSTQLKETADKEKFIGVLRKLKDNMGTVENTSRQKYGAKQVNGVTIVDLEYETKFSRGKVKEEFQFQTAADGSLKLQYYKYKVVE